MAGRRGRLSRRAMLEKLGIATVGASGLVFSLRHGAKIGAVTPRAHAGGKGANAVRVNLGPPVTAGGFGFVSAWVVTRGSAAALVDAGLPDTADDIGAVLTATGMTWRDLQHVILTHYHLDHSGAAADILDRAPQATLWVGPGDIPLFEQSPFPIPGAERLRRTARPAQDNADIFGLRVVATPGHTPGHISLLDAELGALFVGDTMVNGSLDVGALVPGLPVLNPGGGLAPVDDPMFSVDPAQNNASIRRMATLTFELALLSHGPPVDAAALRALAARLR